MKWFWQKKIYMDYAAATPVLPEVERVMKSFWSENFYNPSAIYESAVRVRKAVEDSRKTIARILGAGSRDIIFTSGGTESNNLAILGAFEAAREYFKKPHLIVSDLEHASVAEIVEEIRRRGGEASVVRAREIPKHVKKNTFLVSVALTSSDTGEIQPVAKIGRHLRKWRSENNSLFPYLHTDASQAVNCVEVKVEGLHADLLTLDSAKMYGPKGVGVLVVRPRVALRPMLIGGGQERGLRAGTENVPFIVGFARALSIAERDREKERRRLGELKKIFVDKVKKELPGAELLETYESLPHIVSVAVPGVLPELVVLALDREGIEVSAGTACSSQEEGEVERVRFSFGRYTKPQEVTRASETFVQICVKILKQSRNAAI